MHQRDIIHRDIKVENIICQPNGEIKFENLGKTFRERENKPQDGPLSDYIMSPELIKMKPFSKTDDIWALGCLAYLLATGKAPFEFTIMNTFKVFEKIVHEKAPRIQGKWSKPFSDFVSKCFIKHPGDRWTIERLMNHEFMLTA